MTALTEKWQIRGVKLNPNWSCASGRLKSRKQCERVVDSFDSMAKLLGIIAFWPSILAKSSAVCGWRSQLFCPSLLSQQDATLHSVQRSMQPQAGQKKVISHGMLLKCGHFRICFAHYQGCGTEHLFNSPTKIWSRAWKCCILHQIMDLMFFAEGYFLTLHLNFPKRWHVVHVIFHQLLLLNTLFWFKALNVNCRSWTVLPGLQRRTKIRFLLST